MPQSKVYFPLPGESLWYIFNENKCSLNEIDILRWLCMSNVLKIKKTVRIDQDKENFHLWTSILSAYEFTGTRRDFHLLQSPP